VVLSQDLFSIAQTPINLLGNDGPSSVPQDRILPLLGGGSLLRSSALPEGNGVVVALGGGPIELVVAADMALQFLRVTENARFVFRVFEKIVLRVKERKAIVALTRKINGNDRPSGKAGKNRQNEKKSKPPAIK
jgi:hypothetical protein